MHDMLVALITFFLVEPLQQEIARLLADNRAPQEVVASIVACATEQGPQIVNRALDDLWWAASSAFGVRIGFAVRPGFSPRLHEMRDCHRRRSAVS